MARAISEDSDQTAQMRRLIRVFAGCSSLIVGFVKYVYFQGLQGLQGLQQPLYAPNFEELQANLQPFLQRMPALVSLVKLLLQGFQVPF